MAEDRASGATTIRVEVAYAEPQRQFLREVELARGATVADAIAASGIAGEPGIEIEGLTAGVWSKAANRDQLLYEGDRVELYRPLRVDPKDSRRRRAAGNPLARRS